MSRVVVLPLDDGGKVLVEVGDDEAGFERVGRAREVVGGVTETLQQAVARVRPAAEAVRDSMREMAKPPTKVVVEFGIELTAEAGVVVAKAASEANFKVSLEWSDRPGDTPPAEDDSSDG